MRAGQHIPLRWPANWPRSPRRYASNFDGDRTLKEAVRALVDELETSSQGTGELFATDVIVAAGLGNSTVKGLEDDGAAVYFTRRGKPYVLACDKWDYVPHNVWAIAMHVKALRGQERWGVGTTEQALAGFAALPPSPNAKAHVPPRPSPPPTTAGWRKVLGFPPRSRPTLDEIQAAHRKLARLHHTDVGGDHATMAAINNARDEAVEAVERGDR